MRVVVISHWYAPEPDGRASSLAGALAQRGHEVTAISGFPNYPFGKFYPGYRIHWRQWEHRDGVRVLRLPVYPDHSRSPIRRSANYLSFSASAMLLAPWLVGSIDVVWAFAAPVGVAAAWLSYFRRAPFILDIADLWPETLVATGMLREGWMTRCSTLIGQWVYGRAQALTVQSLGFKENLIQRGVDSNKIHVVENAADSQVYHPKQRDEDLGRKWGLMGRFNVIFAGVMGLAQGLDTIVRAAVRLKDIPQIQFVLIGQGSYLDKTKQLAQQLQATNVVFIPQQPAKEMAKFFSYADALLVHLRRDPLFEITIPSKTQAYLACRRPLIMALAGEGAELVQKHECGLVCSPEDPVAMAAAALDLFKMPEVMREAMAQKGFALYQSRFTKEIMVDRMEHLFFKAAHSH